MSKSIYPKILFIPAAGLLLPWLCGLTVYDHYTPCFSLFTAFYFITVFFAAAEGTQRLHHALRQPYHTLPASSGNMLFTFLTCMLFCSCTGSLAVAGWYRAAPDAVTGDRMVAYILALSATLLIRLLVEEISFLAEEKERDIQTVHVLNRENSEARLHVLQNELDPHFLFNALNTLNHFITRNPEQAYLYNNKLAQVYKYFLVNKDKDMITLEKELDFIGDYYYLLKLRYEEKLCLDTPGESATLPHLMLPPFSLQILLENAIKHNAFSADEPMHIRISLEGEQLTVSNRIRPKPFITDSTRIGLTNLEARYKLLTGKAISIHTTKDQFTVILPVVRQAVL